MEEVKKATNRPSVIKSDYGIFSMLVDRFGKLEISNAEVIADAASQGQVIYKGSLSKYLNSFDTKTKALKEGNVVMGGLSEELILWLCRRYGIEVSIRIDLLPYGQIPYRIDNKH